MTGGTGKNCVVPSRAPFSHHLDEVVGEARAGKLRQGAATPPRAQMGAADDAAEDDDPMTPPRAQMGAAGGTGGSRYTACSEPLDRL